MSYTLTKRGVGRAGGTFALLGPPGYQAERSRGETMPKTPASQDCPCLSLAGDFPVLSLPPVKWNDN